MNIYIPVIGILWFLLAYAIIGLILFVPLVYWQNRFISGNRPVWEGVHILKGIFFSVIVWPIMLGYTIKTEIRYRKKGIL